MPAPPHSSGRAKLKGVAVPGPPAVTTARNIADYYVAVLASVNGNVSKAAKVLKVARHRGAGSAAFVHEGESVYLSYEVAAATIHAGLPASIVNDIAAVLPVEKASVLRAIGIDKATLGRRMHKRADLTPAQGEAAFRTMELTTLATETFGTLEKAALWLKKPHPLLDGASPLDYASNQYALAKVKSMLSAIRYGGVV
jgi:putative toxin-antitoxin system antitoxin component (TIGR02293 family)